MKVGFDKDSCLQILNTAAVNEDQALSLFKAQLSLCPCYGGCSVDCSEMGWDMQITKTEEVKVHPGGECNILYDEEIAITNSSDPPRPKQGTEVIL